jgi:hypothetical protein
MHDENNKNAAQFIIVAMPVQYFLLAASTHAGPLLSALPQSLRLYFTRQSISITVEILARLYKERHDWHSTGNVAAVTPGRAPEP